MYDFDAFNDCIGFNLKCSEAFTLQHMCVAFAFILRDAGDPSKLPLLTFYSNIRFD